MYEYACKFSAVLTKFVNHLVIQNKETLSDARLYLSEKCFLVLDDQMVSKTAENLQAYSYMYNEYAYKFSAVLETIWSSKTGSPQLFFSCGSPD